MHLYRFHFLDTAGAVTRRHSMKLPSDAAAIKLGQRMFAEDDSDCGLEIWQLNRLVHQENRPTLSAAG